MKEENANEYQEFKNKVDNLVVSNNLSWEKSAETKKSTLKTGLKLTPLVIFLLFLPKILNVFNSKNIGDIIFAIPLCAFAIWILYKSFKLLIISKNTISPWIIGWIEKALEAKKVGKMKAKKVKTNFKMGIFFIFFGFILLIADTGDVTVKILTLGMGLMFSFIGLLGIINYIAWKKPNSVFYLIEHNRRINILFFLVISIICLSIIFVTSSSIISEF